MAGLIARALMLGLLLTLAGAGASGCKARPQLDPNFPSTPADFARARAFEVKPGMKRASVERVFGIPTHMTRGKEGELLCHYQLENTWRSVQYNDKSRVVVVYP